jgi:hypothetical protein
MRQALRFIDAAIESLRDYDRQADWVKQDITRLEYIRRNLIARIAFSTQRAFK